MVTTRVALVRAPNPSPMTLTGTNSYVIDCGDGDGICIDPGPPNGEHVDAILKRAAALGVRISAILVTHGHPDHAPAASLLKERTDAPIFAHFDAAFAHDRDLHDNDTVEIGNTVIDVVDAPGHTFDHVVFYDRQVRALFTGDVVLGEGTVVIAPPNGAMRPYEQTLHRLLRDFADAEVIYGGHGPPVGKPQEKLREYIAHRKLRQRELLGALAEGPQTIPQLVRRIYAETNRVLWPAAARQILAYLLALEDEERVRSRELPRAMNGDEIAILNPDWSSIVGQADARVVEEELGAMLQLDAIREYEVIPE